jgi:hypothetical protein
MFNTADRLAALSTLEDLNAEIFDLYSTNKRNIQKKSSKTQKGRSGSSTCCTARQACHAKVQNRIATGQSG